MNCMILFKHGAEKSSEFEYSGEENCMLRTIEYIQSVLASTENKYNQDENEDESVRLTEICGLIEQLYLKIPNFYKYWSSYIKKIDFTIDDEIIKYIVEAEMYSFVRGERYQIYQLENVRELLAPHNDMRKK